MKIWKSQSKFLLPILAIQFSKENGIFVTFHFWHWVFDIVNSTKSETYCYDDVTGVSQDLVHDITQEMIKQIDKNIVDKNAPIAQSVEQLAVNQRVGGSSPSRGDEIQREERNIIEYETKMLIRKQKEDFIKDLQDAVDKKRLENKPV